MPSIDPNVLARQVEGQLLRAARPALRRLARASRGNGDFRNDLELRACLGLARVAATLLRSNHQAREQAIDVYARLFKGGVR